MLAEAWACARRASMRSEQLESAPLVPPISVGSESNCRCTRAPSMLNAADTSSGGLVPM